MFQAFRIYDFVKGDKNSDFYGVFVDRLYPRGVKKEIFCSFLWLKSVTPSNELRSWFHEDKEAKIGLNELKTLEKKHGKIALLTATKDINLSHVAVLLELLRE